MILNEKNQQIFRIIIGVLLIVAAFLVTVRYIRMIPPFIKALVLAIDALLVYYVYRFIILAKKRRNNE